MIVLVDPERAAVRDGECPSQIEADRNAGIIIICVKRFKKGLKHGRLDRVGARPDTGRP